MCFLIQEKAFDKSESLDTNKETVRQKYAFAYCEIVYLLYTQQKYMVRWGNSLSMTFRFSNLIRQGGHRIITVPTRKCLGPTV